MDITESAARKLKELIDNNGPDFLATNPYVVYKELVKSGSADKKTAGAVMFLLTTDIPNEIGLHRDRMSLTKQIQKSCSFNRKMADFLADIMLRLYSDKNNEEWKNKDLSGFEKFRDENLSFRWEGFSVWQASGGGVDCYYNADIFLKPVKNLAVGDELADALKKNPFLKTDDIRKEYIRQMTEYLNREFEKYCTEDDYYEPVVEDFELKSCVEEWSKKNGFKVLSCEGKGDDSGFVPNSVRSFVKYERR